MNITTVAIAIGLACGLVIGGSGAWVWQQHRIDALKLEAQNVRIEQQRNARQALERVTAQRDKVQADAAKRSIDSRASAAAARTELDRLRVATDAAMRAAADNITACVDAAATATRLLDKCAAEYQSLGERADRHVNDIKTLVADWPK